MMVAGGLVMVDIATLKVVVTRMTITAAGRPIMVMVGLLGHTVRITPTVGLAVVSVVALISNYLLISE